MSVWWDYFWPAVAAGMVIGVAAGLFAFRRSKQMVPLAIAAAAAVGAAALWHGPLGAADRLAATIERDVQATLTYYEMTQVDVRLQRAPMTRRLALKGPADEFQRGELVKVLDTLPGVTGATWNQSRGLPLILEAALAAVAGFLAGLVLAYLFELRRRHNAQWKW
jgi:hypothetical protein